MSETMDVLVIGGGYAGVMAANRLTRRQDVAVTLVNPRASFVERIRLHQLVGGSDDAVVDYGDVLADGVRLLVDRVSRVDAAQRTVSLASGATLGYDYLVYAVGSESTDRGVPGAADLAHPVATLEEAQRLRQALRAAPASAPVTVVGAGPAGIETAAELAEQGRQVTLVCGGDLNPYLHPRARRSIATRLAALGVTVLDGPGTIVAAVRRNAVELVDGRSVASRLTVWATGFGVPDLARNSGLSTDALGRLLTDETLTSVDDVRIVAAGDAVSPSALPFRMGCQSAVQTGPQAAETVLSRIAGQPAAPVDVVFAGQCISLGRRSGFFQFAHRYDVATRFYLGGRAGAALKRLVNRGTVWQLAYEARRPGALTWKIKDRRRQERPRATHRETRAGAPT